ncbi:Cytochrome f [Vitis vinifera]|uniref:Cytochrome f n=1 Tax=Vitis vinifera TaxID=29760 RepID=A0A438D9X0_VITVI|nr:Cytochrome f [Vitis vinifera]
MHIPFLHSRVMENPREATGRIVCANCHLANKPVDIEVPQAVGRGQIYPDGSKSNNTVYNATAAGIVSKIIRKEKGGLYSTVMRALGLDEAQLLTLFPLSLSGVTQRWYASLESSRRRTWEDLAQEFLRQYSFSGDTSITRRELELLRQGSDESVSSFISRWRERIAEMIERPSERDQMGISLVQALLDVDDGLSRGLWSDITPSPDTEGKELVDHMRAMEIPRSDFPPLQHHHPHSVQQYPSVHPHTVTVRPSFQFQRPQTSIPRHEQSRPHRRRQRTYSDLGMPLDRAFERLRSTGVLVPLAPRPLPSTLPPRFRAHEFCAFHQMAGHRTDIVLLYVIPYRILLTVMLSFSLGCIYRHVETPRALIFTRHFDIAYLVGVFWDYIRLMHDGYDTEYIEIRLLQLRHPSSSRGAPGVAMPSLPHLTSSTPATLGASHPRLAHIQCSSSIPHPFHWLPTRPPPQFRGPPVVTVPQDRFPPHRRCRRHFSDLSAPLSRVFEMFQAIGFLAPLAPRALPDPVPPHSGHTCRRPSPAVPDLIDFGVECEDFEPRVDLAWRGYLMILDGLRYEDWLVADEIIAYFSMGGLHFALLTFYTGIGALQCMHALFRSFMSLGPRGTSFSLSFPIIASLHFVTSRWFFILFFIISIVCSASSSPTPSGDHPQFITWRVVMSFSTIYPTDIDPGILG